MIKKLIDLKEKKYIGKFWEMGDYEEVGRRFNFREEAEEYIENLIKETHEEYGYYISMILTEGHGVGQMIKNETKN